jgi:hypothetical protein
MSRRRLLAVIVIAVVATAAAYELGRQLRSAWASRPDAGVSAQRLPSAAVIYHVTFATTQ